MSGADVDSSVFSLHPNLAADCHMVCDLALCRLLLLDDCRYVWTVLVPRRPDAVELHDLNRADRIALIDETVRVGQVLQQAFDGQKLNVGALGNVVPQLHMHVILRRVDDPAWPGPVWGHSAAQPYTAAKKEAVVHQLKSRLHD